MTLCYAVGAIAVNSLIGLVLESLLRDEAPAPQLLEAAGERDPVAASQAFLVASERRELARCRASWVPALLAAPYPGMGAANLAALASAYAEQEGCELDPSQTPGLVPILGASEHLGRCLVANPSWADDLVGDPPVAYAPGHKQLNFAEIREAKLRGTIKIVARERMGCPLETSFEEIADLADESLRQALRCASDATGIEAPSMLAMGQLAGRELALYAPIVLLFVEPAESGLANVIGRAQQLEVFLKHFVQELEADSSLGALFSSANVMGRGDVLAANVEDTLAMFTAWAGNPASGGGGGLRPLVARSQVALELVEGYHGAACGVTFESLRVKERRRKQRRSRDAQSDDLARGVGSVSDVDAVARGLRARVGDNLVPLEVDAVLTCLSRMRSHTHQPAVDCDELAEAYSWLRRAEHSLQLMHGSTSQIPSDPEGQLSLARCMGYREPETSVARERWSRDRQDAHDQIEKQFEILFG